MAEENREKLVLKPGEVSRFLCNFNRTADNECLQMVELNMADKVVDQLNAKSADETKDAQYIDLSMNSIAECGTLSVCQQLVRLNISKNKVKSLLVFCQEENFPNLKWLDVSNNKFSDFPAIKCPKLEYLDISYNKLEKVNEGWTGHERLRIVKCIDNKFKTLAPFKSMPKLEELYMA